MKVIVQKFGGTSVANDENREKVAQKIVDMYSQGYSIVVVVSAIGRNGDPYATDTLLDLVNKEVMNKRDLDLLMACGEIISSVVLSNLLSRKNYETIVLTGYQAGIVTNRNFGNADVIKVNPDKVYEGLKENKIVIVTGFQGATEEGEITTLGRGGSDTSAVLLGEALGCEHVEIFTDVDGIMTADPRVVPEARVLENMCYSEVYQLAEDGAKVIHSRAVEIAERSNIPIVIKNTLTDCEGTLIRGNEAYNASTSKYNTLDKLITGITYKKNRVQIEINKCHKDFPLEYIMSEITENDISIDLINFFNDKKVFTIDKEDLKFIEEILDKGDCDYNTLNNCTKLSLTGYKIRGIPGVMARIVKVLSKEKINILQTSDSHTTIWCLVSSDDAYRAIRALHKEFDLDKK